MCTSPQFTETSIHYLRTVRWGKRADGASTAAPTRCHEVAELVGKRVGRHRQRTRRGALLLSKVERGREKGLLTSKPK